MTCRPRRLAVGAGAVIEGCDIGTAVFPDAPVKVLLDASAAVRASRRAGERDAGVAVAASSGATIDLVVADLARRDRLDSTRSSSSPLRAADDTVHLDSSALDARQVVERVLDLARGAGITPAQAAHARRGVRSASPT